jgi:SAM-dependent methyltransferase
MKFMPFNRDAWLDWYKDGRVAEQIPILARLLKEANEERALDFGTGTGRHTVYLTKMGFKVYGFDWSEASVRVANRELARQGLSANLRVWDMTETPLPYADYFFDGVSAVRVLHHTYTEKIRRIASEIERITKVGSLVYVEVPTYAKALRQKLEGMRSKEPEPRTFVPSEGDEAGIPHHHCTKVELKYFPNFTVRALEEKDEHYCFTGIKN